MKHVKPTTAVKINFRQTRDCYVSRQGEFRSLFVPVMRYLMIDGHGDPNTSPAFDSAVRALYPVAYALKFTSKQQLGRDYLVPPLEGLWWAQNMDAFTTSRDKSQWDWTLMVLCPDWLADEVVLTAIDTVSRKRNRPERLDDVRLELLDEGQCIQTLHVGAFDDEADVLRRMHHEVIPQRGLTLSGTHHEIYLSDFRRVAPEKRRTILRQPVRPAGAI